MRYTCQILMKLEFHEKIIEKLNIKFHDNPSSGSRAVPCRWTDRRTDLREFTEVNSIFFSILRTRLKTILATILNEKTNLYLVPSLRMNCALTPLPLHAFLACTWMSLL
jgi:hypothetical protein